MRVRAEPCTCITYHYPTKNMDLSKACGPPPTAAIYTDLSTAVAAIQAHAKCNGYALFKRDSRPLRVVYACDRYSKPQARAKNPDIHESKQWKGSRSKKCNCQMKVALKRDEISGSWELEVIQGLHNYEASADPTAHPAYRIAALDPRIYAQVENLALSGLNNAQILAVIYRESLSVLLLSRDVSNLVQITRLQ